jgi:type IX secretion system PorP/SprF family membrane protein
MKAKSVILMLFVLVIPAYTFAQDEFFSQFYANRFFTNPSFAGDEGGNSLRISSSFRQQWNAIGKPFVTTGIGLDKGWNIDNNRRISAGMIIINDRAGNSQLNSNMVLGAIAFGTALNRSSRLSGALQFGFSQKSISFDALRFDRQYNGRSVDEKLSNGETFSSTAFSEYSANIGLAYAKKMNRRNNFTLALGYVHINRSGNSFLGNDSQKQYSRFTITGIGEFNLSGTDAYVLPSFLIQSQGPSIMVVAGGLFRINKGTDSKYTAYYTSSNILFGLHYRYRDALIPSLHYELKKSLLIGISYDVNVSALSGATNLRGGFEIRVSYCRRKSKRVVNLAN